MKKIALRNASAQDWETIVALHKEQQAAQGTKYELPLLFWKDGLAPNIAVCLVGEDEDGKLRNVIYCEKTIEMRFIGCDPRATAYSWRQIKGLSYVLRCLGYRWLETFIPKQLSAAIAKPLSRAGFACTEDELVHYTLDMRGKQ